MTIEPELLVGARAFPETQVLFATEPLRQLEGTYTVSWYGSDKRPEEPAFVLVNRARGDLAGLAGEILVVSYGDRTIYVYCLAPSDLPTDFAVSRRAFIGLGLLTNELLDCTVAVGE